MATCLIVEAPLEHAKHYVVITDRETFDFSFLPIIEERAGRPQLVASVVRFFVKNGIDRGIEDSVDIQN
ncbi:MAG: hypothetical protein K0R27_187 [Xanthobacteraceae bacterium]|jgi:hypothetical protein|nr:hypothetical protein [Xanthobacteraceae bacterium]